MMGIKGNHYYSGLSTLGANVFVLRRAWIGAKNH